MLTLLQQRQKRVLTPPRRKRDRKDYPEVREIFSESCHLIKKMVWRNWKQGEQGFVNYWPARNRGWRAVSFLKHQRHSFRPHEWCLRFTHAGNRNLNERLACTLSGTTSTCRWSYEVLLAGSKDWLFSSNVYLAVPARTCYRQGWRSRFTTIRKKYRVTPINSNNLRWGEKVSGEIQRINFSANWSTPLRLRW